MPKEFRAKANRRILNPDAPPITIHHASFHRLGGEIVMDLGFHDMAQLVQRIIELETKSSPPRTDDDGLFELEVDVTVFARYAMGADTFLRLRDNVEEIYRAMVKSGHLPEPEEKPEETK